MWYSFRSLWLSGLSRKAPLGSFALIGYMSLKIFVCVNDTCRHREMNLVLCHIFLWSTCLVSANQRESATLHLTHMSNVIHMLNTFYKVGVGTVAICMNGCPGSLESSLSFVYAWLIKQGASITGGSLLHAPCSLLPAPCSFFIFGLAPCTFWS